MSRARMRAGVEETTGARGCEGSEPLGGEHLAELGRERLGFAGLAVFAAEETAVIAREDRGLDAEALRDWLSPLRPDLLRLPLRLDPLLLLPLLPRPCAPCDADADPRLAYIGDQFGMFSMLPLGKEQVLKLRTDHAIYMADSGRFNLVGLGDDQIDRFTAAVVEALGS